MKPYPMDLRKRVLKDCDVGMGSEMTAATISGSPAWVGRLKPRRRGDGRVPPHPPRNRRVPKRAAQHERVRDLVAAKPGLTPGEIRRELGTAVCTGTLWDALAPDECRNHLRHAGYRTGLTRHGA